MRLIDADALKEQLKTDAKYATPLAASGFLNAIIAVDMQPTVEVVPLMPVAKMLADACNDRIDTETWAALLRETDYGS